jgi:hypothetical protein
MPCFFSRTNFLQLIVELECLLQLDWIGIVEVVLLESVVSSFPIALDVGLAWPRRAPMPRPLHLGVLIMRVAGGNQQGR